ncbi:hypothetical protein M2323_004460 [Rhodoblastus acidophilus]|nr:hypothetical protein [Rhodoblastus acidophilus]MCW2335511.1 hypothetical protein [Rhodoblastus acidophilus]
MSTVRKSAASGGLVNIREDFREASLDPGQLQLAPRG